LARFKTTITIFFHNLVVAYFLSHHLCALQAMTLKHLTLNVTRQTGGDKFASASVD